jgi:hypothetical protein
MLTNQQFAECRDRSYTVPPANPNVCCSGQNIVPVGSIAGLRYDTYFGGNLRAGTRVRALVYVNAGFRGIECWGELLDGDRAGQRITVSAGNLYPASN